MWLHVLSDAGWGRGLCRAVTAPSVHITGIPSMTFAWGLWALLGAVTVLLLISLAVLLSQWTSRRSKSQEGQGW